MDVIEIPKIDGARLRESFPSLLKDCRYFDVGVGWTYVVTQMCVNLAKLPAGLVVVHEMTQKLGGLRVTLETSRLSSEQEATARHVQVLAQERSRYRCEVCGHAGFISKAPADAATAWLYCLCHRHLPKDRRGWPLDRRERRYRIGDVHWVYDDLLDRLRVDEPGNA